MWTYRIKYTKLGRVRFISHLDVMRAIIRAMNRAAIPTAYTEGFNPRPKLSMGPALPLGCESVCELADIVLSRMFSPETLHQKLKAAMPRGLDLLETGWVLGSSPRLSHASSALYMIELNKDMADTADARVGEFLAKDKTLIERIRKDSSKVVNVRHFVSEAGVEAQADSRWLRVRITIGAQGSCSASEVARILFKLSADDAKCLRTIRTDLGFDGPKG
jgi:radical SAM-linked protein